MHYANTIDNALVNTILIDFGGDGVRGGVGESDAYGTLLM